MEDEEGELSGPDAPGVGGGTWAAAGLPVRIRLAITSETIKMRIAKTICLFIYSPGQNKIKQQITA